MPEVSSIGWTDGTFNPWWGCERVSPACAHCYADTFAKRVGMPGLWKTLGDRRLFARAHWDAPLHWNDKALAKYGRPMRVFCASMADVFEDHPALDSEREKLWHLIAETPNLHWQLLTKRPENVARMVPWQRWSDERDYDRNAHGWPTNVWIGTSIENSRHTYRADVLREIPAAVRFISAEPLLGSLVNDQRGLVVRGPAPQRLPLGIIGRDPLDLTGIDWLIVGGESGPKARPTRAEWMLELVRAARDAGVAVFVKQLGVKLAREHGIKGKAENPDEWPAALDELKLQQFPNVPAALAA